MVVGRRRSWCSSVYTLAVMSLAVMVPCSTAAAMSCNCAQLDVVLFFASR